jgi:hypothetical protein
MAGTTSGYCSTDLWGGCHLHPDPIDVNAYCSSDCVYVASPPYGCVWDDTWKACLDGGCSHNPGYGCVSPSAGSCQCATAESFEQPEPVMKCTIICERKKP